MMLELSKPVREGGNMAKIRWRLLFGLASLGAAVMLTFPAGAARQLESRVGEIWPRRSRHPVRKLVIPAIVVRIS